MNLGGVTYYLNHDIEEKVVLVNISGYPLKFAGQYPVFIGEVPYVPANEIMERLNFKLSEVNGAKVIDGCNMIPVGALEALGHTVAIIEGTTAVTVLINETTYQVGNSPTHQGDSNNDKVSLSVVYNGNTIKLSNPIIERNGYAFFPIEDIINGIGAEFIWDDQSYTVIGYFNGNKIEIPVRNLSYIINGNKLDVPAEFLPIIENDITYVYLDYIIQGFGLNMDWDERTQTIKITDE